MGSLNENQYVSTGHGKKKYNTELPPTHPPTYKTARIWKKPTICGSKKLVTSFKDGV